MNRFDVWAPRVLSLLRIVAALIFMAHGTQKILGFPASDHPAPAVLSLAWTSGMLELIGGALLALGLFTRPVAFILSGEMAVAYFLAHAPRALFPVLNGGDAAILYCFIFLYLVFAGPGPWSLDAARGRETPPDLVPASEGRTSASKRPMQA
jgi:putative oxidoreductase